MRCWHNMRQRIKHRERQKKRKRRRRKKRNSSAVLPKNSRQKLTPKTHAKNSHPHLNKAGMFCRPFAAFSEFKKRVKHLISRRQPLVAPFAARFNSTQKITKMWMTDNITQAWRAFASAIATLSQQWREIAQLCKLSKKSKLKKQLKRKRQLKAPRRR